MENNKILRCDYGGYKVIQDEEIDVYQILRFSRTHLKDVNSHG